MEWSVSDGPGRYKPTLQDRDGSVSVASMTIDGNEVQLPELSVESEGKPGRAIVTIDGSRRVAHVARSGRHVVGAHRREGPRGHPARAGQQLVGGRGQPEGAHARDRSAGPGEGGAEGPRGPAPDDPGGDEDGAQGGGAEGRRDNQGQLLRGREGRHGIPLAEIGD